MPVKLCERVHVRIGMAETSAHYKSMNAAYLVDTFYLEVAGFREAY